MDSSSIERIKQLFDHLIALPASEREDWLAAQAGVDDATRRHLHGLLAADARVGDMTAWPALRPDAKPADWLGRRIGPYEVVSELGRGGMGSVFLARRVDGGVEQQVAIKIVRPERLDASTLARFRLERQVLALLQHPNIAAMLDLGELPDGSPYAVMEYVDGTPLGDYIQQHSPSLRQRLDLFLQLCDAVSYAHGSMVVHRDLKPGNVLVDRKGRPRLLDFGIAKPLQSRLGAIEVEETAADNRFFSLAHAAPEQLRDDGRIGAACDVYGLGTLLYELLAGVPPFALDGRSYAELERDILENDPPPPSRRAAAARSNAAAKLPIDRDLDLITLRCLRKAPEERYSSVDALADDVRRFLAGKPVQARRGNLLYRAGRFVGRHRLAVTLSAVLIGASLIGGLLLWRQQRATVEQHSRAEEMTDLIIDALRSADPAGNSTKDLTARDVFERIGAQVQASPQLNEQSRARLLLAIARIHTELGQFQQAEALLAGLDTGTQDALQRAEIDLLRARTELSLGHFDAANKILAKPLPPQVDADLAARWHLAQATWAYEQGTSLQTLKLLDSMDLAGTQPETQEEHRRQRAWALRQESRRDEAISEQAELLRLQRARLGERSPAVYDSLYNLAFMQMTMGKIENAEETSRQLFALADAMYSRTSRRYVPALSLARQIEDERGNLARAIELELEILAINRDQVGENSPYVARTSFNLARLYLRSGNTEEAANYARRAMTLAERVWTASNMNVPLFRTSAAGILLERSEYTEAREIARRALADIDAHPEFKEYDIYPIVVATESLASFALDHDEARRRTLPAALKYMRDESNSIITKDLAKRLITTAERLGVKPAD